MAEVKSKEIETVKQTIYVVPLDVVLGQLEMVKQSLINQAAQIEIKEKGD